MLSMTQTSFWRWPTLVVVVLLLLLWLVPDLAGVRRAYQWTDYLIFILLTGILYLAAYIRTKEHLRGPWFDVFRNKRAVASVVVLSFFVIAGLLDSIHFRTPLLNEQGEVTGHYSVEVTSVMDELLSTLRAHNEKTYSAPFATHLYMKEMLVSDTGKQVRDYPRLKYGGAHLLDPQQDKLVDILQTALSASGIAILLWGSFILLSALLVAKFRIKQLRAVLTVFWAGQSPIPWKVMLGTAGIMIWLLSVLLLLSNSYHVFGTDKVGQDVLYLAIKSIRTGLVIGTLTTLVMLPFAVVLGIMAGYFRGWVDDVIQYLYTTLNSIPGVLLIAAAILSIQVYMENHPQLFETATDRADLRLLALCVVLGITSWTGLCRLLRGEALKLREMDYIQAATAFGVGHFTILARHILPNVLHIVLILVVLDFSGLVLAEAVLSYVGVGVDPSTYSWGNMINGARLELAREPIVWWSLMAAFILMFTLVLAANLFSDAVRDAFDPRIQTGNK